MLLDIIVPVYNVESYLKECIESLLAQTYKQLKIILVDDGSTDNSGLICDEFAALHNNICVFHKTNGGLMSAWKYGVTHSTGDVIGFVDSDDWVDADMYEKLIRTMNREQSDIVSCGLIKGEYLKNQSKYTSGCHRVEELFPSLINDGTFMGRGLIPSRVVKIFKREIVETSLMYCEDSVSLGEDLVMTFASVLGAKKISIIGDYFPYHYRINQNSITHTFKPIMLDNAILFNDALKSINHSLSSYDFSRQIDADLICNAINIFEIACNSNADVRSLCSFVRSGRENEIIQEAMKNVEFSRWRARYKTYFLLFKKRCVVGMVMFGKLIGLLRKFKKR